MKKCFVISPIGQPGSEVREQADAVLDYIIRPALKDMGIEPVRADQMAEPGLITDQMIVAILNYDFCIADLSGHNPNVFYELAIAQAAGRPVVLMKHAGQAIPFDVKDYRLIEYDLRPQSMKDDRWVSVLKEHVERVLAPDYKPPRLLGDKISSASDSDQSYFLNARSEEFGGAPRFHDIVRNASEYCNMMGVSLKAWGSIESEHVLESLTERNIPIRILIMYSKNPGLGAMINGALLPAEDLEDIARQTDRMAEYFGRFGGTVQVRTNPRAARLLNSSFLKRASNRRSAA